MFINLKTGLDSLLDSWLFSADLCKTPFFLIQRNRPCKHSAHEWSMITILFLSSFYLFIYDYILGGPVNATVDIKSRKQMHTSGTKPAMNSTVYDQLNVNEFSINFQ